MSLSNFIKQFSYSVFLHYNIKMLYDFVCFKTEDTAVSRIKGQIDISGIQNYNFPEVKWEVFIKYL